MVGLRKGWTVGAGVLAAVVGTAVLVFAVPIASGGSPPLMLNASLAPETSPSTNPNPNPPIFGLPPGKVPWVITAGKVQLQANGMLHVSVEGLVVPPKMTNPLPEIAASVYCNNNDTAAATTPSVPFSAKGNAQINTMVSLPAFCAAPAVLLRPDTGSGAAPMYIAFDGTA